MTAHAKMLSPAKKIQKLGIIKSGGIPKLRKKGMQRFRKVFEFS